MDLIKFAKIPNFFRTSKFFPNNQPCEYRTEDTQFIKRNNNCKSAPDNI